MAIQSLARHLVRRCPIKLLGKSPDKAVNKQRRLIPVKLSNKQSPRRRKFPLRKKARIRKAPVCPAAHSPHRSLLSPAKRLLAIKMHLRARLRVSKRLVKASKVPVFRDPKFLLVRLCPRLRKKISLPLTPAPVTITCAVT